MHRVGVAKLDLGVGFFSIEGWNFERGVIRFKNMEHPKRCGWGGL